MLQFYSRNNGTDALYCVSLLKKLHRSGQITKFQISQADSATKSESGVFFKLWSVESVESVYTYRLNVADGRRFINYLNLEFYFS